jgi:hypothetical protein
MERLASMAVCECGGQLEIFLKNEKQLIFPTGYRCKSERKLLYICTKCGKESEVQKQDLISILLSRFYIEEVKEVL